MTGLDLSDVKSLWIRPAAAIIGLPDPGHVNIATGIGAVESNYRFLRQRGGGTARCFWEMEIATHDDMCANSLPAPCRSRISTGLRQILRGAEPHVDLMITLPLYGAAMCIAKVFLAPAALPDPANPEALCRYWKQFYNTAGGAGSVTPDMIAMFRTAIAA